jgi:hypothetical protein
MFEPELDFQASVTIELRMAKGGTWRQEVMLVLTGEVGLTRTGRSRGVPVAGERHPCPPATIEFVVADVASAAAELTAKGYRLIHGARTEPSAQITARLLSPEGLLVAVCYSLAFRDT